MFAALNMLNLSASKLRTDMVTYLRNHPEIVAYVDFQAEHRKSFAQYIEYMSRDGVRGDGIVLEVVVEWRCSGSL